MPTNKVCIVIRATILCTYLSCRSTFTLGSANSSVTTAEYPFTDANIIHFVHVIINCPFTNTFLLQNHQLTYIRLPLTVRTGSAPHLERFCTRMCHNKITTEPPLLIKDIPPEMYLLRKIGYLLKFKVLINSQIKLNRFLSAAQSYTGALAIAVAVQSAFRF